MKRMLVKNLIIKAEKDIKTAQDLFKLKHYDWSLFIWHLAIEMIVKAKIISLGKQIIYTHNLVRLFKLAEISLDNKLLSQLNEITTFNIEARYDDYKLSFYRKANKAYAVKWSLTCEKIYSLVRKQL